MTKMKNATALAAVVAMAGSAMADVVEIPAMTVPNVVLDFDQMPVGPTTLGEINSTFNVDVQSITLFEAGRGEPTGYNTNAFGNALKPDANGDLEIIEPDGETPGELEGFEIELPILSTEFGFSVGDRVGTIDTIEFYNGPDLVDTYNDQLTMDGEIHYLQSDMEFDRVIVRETANWVVPDMVVQVPAPAGAAIFGLAGLAAMRRRR